MGGSFLFFILCRFFFSISCFFHDIVLRWFLLMALLFLFECYFFIVLNFVVCVSLIVVFCLLLLLSASLSSYMSS